MISKWTQDPAVPPFPLIFQQTGQAHTIHIIESVRIPEKLRPYSGHQNVWKSNRRHIEPVKITPIRGMLLICKVNWKQSKNTKQRHLRSQSYSCGSNRNIDKTIRSRLQHVLKRPSTGWIFNNQVSSQKRVVVSEWFTQLNLVETRIPVISTFECLSLRICPHSIESCIVLMICRHSELSVPQFLDDFEAFLSYCKRLCYNLLLCGDINISINKYRLLRCSAQ